MKKLIAILISSIAILSLLLSLGQTRLIQIESIKLDNPVKLISSYGNYTCFIEQQSNHITTYYQNNKVGQINLPDKIYTLVSYKILKIFQKASQNELLIALANQTHLLILNTNRILNSSIIKQYSLYGILQIQWGAQNQLLMYHHNTDITYIKNNKIVWRRSFQKLNNSKITSILYDKIGNQFIIGTNDGKVSILQSNFIYYQNLILCLNFQEYDKNQMRLNDCSQNGTYAAITELNLNKGLIIKNNLNGSFGDFSTNSTILKSSSLNISEGSYSIIMLVKFLNKNKNMTLFSQQNQTYFLFNQGNFLLFSKTSSGNYLKYFYPSFSFSLCQNWLHIALVLNRTKNQISLYINGINYGTENVQFQLFSSSQKFYFGSCSNILQNESVAIYLKNILIYNKALTKNQLSALAQNFPTIIQITNHDAEITVLKMIKNSSIIVSADKQGYLKLSQFNDFKINRSSVNVILYQKYHQKPITSVIEAYFSDKNKLFIITVDTDSNQKQIQFNTPFLFDNFSIYQSTNFSNYYIIGQRYNNTALLVPKNLAQLKKITYGQQMACHQSCGTCSQIYNEFQCLSCARLYFEKISQSGKNGFICVTECSSEFNKIFGKCIDRYPIVQQLSQIIIYVLQLPYLRMLLRVLYPIFYFIQDIWLYRYHQRQYSQFLETIFVQIDRIAKQKIVPQFIRIDIVEEKFSDMRIFYNNENKHYSRLSFRQKQIESYIFLSNAVDILTYNLITTFVIAFFFLSLWKIFYWITNEDDYLITNMIYNYLNSHAGFVLFIASWVQTNLILLSFYCFYQISAPFYWNYYGKLNMTACYIILFIIFVYSVAFYFLVFKLTIKKTATNILGYSKWHFKSFLLGTYVNSFKHLLNGYVHSTLTQYYILQISSLLAINLMQLIFVLYFFRKYSTKCHLVWFAVYTATFCVMDSTFLINYLFPEIFDGIVEKFQIFCIGMILAMCCLLFLTDIIFSVHEFIKQNCVNNKISNQFNSKINKNHKKQQKQSKKTKKLQIKKMTTEINIKPQKQQFKTEEKSQIKLEEKSEIKNSTVIVNTNKNQNHNQTQKTIQHRQQKNQKQQKQQQLQQSFGKFKIDKKRKGVRTKPKIYQDAFKQQQNKQLYKKQQNNKQKKQNEQDKQKDDEQNFFSIKQIMSTHKNKDPYKSMLPLKEKQTQYFSITDLQQYQARKTNKQKTKRDKQNLDKNKKANLRWVNTNRQSYELSELKL